MRLASRSGWGRALDWSGARLSFFESAALVLGACVLVVYGGARLQARFSQALESSAFDRERHTRAQERLYLSTLPGEALEQPDEAEPSPDSAPSNPPSESVRRAEALYAPEPALDERLRSEWSPRRRKAYEQSLTRDGVLPLGRLEIPSIELSVMILPGTDDWTLNRAVGHIDGTSLPGETGNVGIAGHRDGFFRGLRLLESGARIWLTTLDGTYEYIVRDMQVVDPSQVEVLQPSPKPTLTLVTCYPFFHVGSAPQRYIIRATLASSDVRQAQGSRSWPPSGTDPTARR